MFTRLSRGAIGLALCSAFITPSTSDGATCPDRPTGKTVQQVVDAWLAAHQSASFGMCAVAIDDGKKGVGCVGKATASKGADNQTLFQIGSVTKTMTAAVLARRVVEGRLGLNERIDGHLPPQFRVGASNTITFRDLATHHSGLPRAPKDYSEHPTPRDADFQHFEDCVRGPNCLGFSYIYSNFGFQILGYTLSYDNGWDNWFDDAYYSVLMLSGMNDTMPYERWNATRPAYFTSHAATSHLLQTTGTWKDIGNDPVERCSTADPSGCLYSSIYNMKLWLEYHMGILTPLGVLKTAREKYLRGWYESRDNFIDSLITGKHPDEKIGLAWNFDLEAPCDKLQPPKNGFDHYVRISKGGGVDGQHAWMAYLQDPNDPLGVSKRGVVLLLNSDPKGGMSTSELGADLLESLPR